MNKNCGIYKWSSPSGKIYIGQAQNLKRRKWCFLSENHRYTSGKSHIDAAREKYGVKNFIYEVLEYCSIEELNEREKYWISFYDSTNPKIGYNNTSGGNKFKFTDEVKMKMKLSAKNRPKRSKESLSKASISLKKIKHSEEWNKKVGIGNSKKVYQLDEEGKIIKIFNSQAECAKFFNVSTTLISFYLKGKTPNKFNIKKICS